MSAPVECGSSKLPSLALLLVLVELCARNAAAQTYPIAGNARFQIGNELPIPVTFAAPPNGRVLAIPGAAVQQTAGPDPKQITIAPGQLTAPGSPVTVPLFLANSAIFEKRTSIAVGFPKQQATLKAGGRTGAQTVTFCAGQVVTPTGNPMCSGPGAPGNVIPGLLRYTKTLNQFGGPAQPALGGGVRSGLRAIGTPPCHHLFSPPCIVASALGKAPPTGAWGGPFGFTATTSGSIPSPGIFNAGVTPAGFVSTRTSVGLGSGVANPATSFGGPWTTGRVTVSVTQNVGPGVHLFLLSGSDNRVDGVGTISLVSGGIARRALTGSTGNRGWLNLTISAPPQPIPSITSWGVGALALALTGVGLWRGRRTAPRTR